ncbi:MAG: hypothetical protein ACLFQA_10435 [Bacteroidales bacterium]
MMKTFFKTATGLMLMVLLIVLSSCQKYEDGPWFSIYSKQERVTGNWYFELVREDGVDKTEEYADQRVNMSKNGDLYWVQGYYDSPWDTYGPGGTWKFANDKNQIEMHFTLGVTEEYTIVWDITRMAYADLRLERFEDGKKIEWRMWKH